MSSKSSKLRWFGISVFALIILLAASVLVVLFISSARLRSQMAKSGKIRTIEEIIGPKIPDNQNAAPIYNLAIKELEMTGTREALEPLQMSEISTPEEFRHKAAELEAAVEKAAPLMVLLNQAVEKPECQFWRDWRHPFAVTFHELQYMRSLARIASGTAVVRVHQGRMQEAVDAVDTGIKITNAAKCEPTMISQFVGTAVLSIMTNRLRYLPQHGHITEAQAKRLSDTLSGIDHNRGFTESLEVERAAGLWLYREVRRDPKAYAAMMASVPYHASRARRIADNTVNYAKRPLLGFDQAAFLRGMQINIEASKYSYREAQAKRLWVQDSDLPSYARVARLMTPLMNRMNARRDQGVSEADGSRIFLALLAYKDRYGSYPATLKELKDKLGWKLPKDVFSGKDFIYKRRGEGFLLYGVGEDMKDDGGKWSAKKRGPDMVWELKR